MKFQAQTSDNCTFPLIIKSYFSASWELPLCASLCVILGLQTILLNCPLLQFYSKSTSQNRIIPYLYQVIPTSDLLSGFVGFLNAGHFIILNSSSLHEIICSPLSDSLELLDKKLLLFLSYFLTAYLSVTSAFLHTLLTVVRCINISFPFYRLDLERIRRILYFYLLVMGLLVIVDISYIFYISYTTPPRNMESYFYYMVFVRVVSVVKLLLIEHGWSEAGFAVHAALDLIVPFVLPCLVCSVCLGVLVYALMWRRHLEIENSRVKRRCESVRSQYHITGTIALLTAHFVLCNTVLTIIILLQRYFNSKGTSKMWHGKAAAAAFCLVPLFNSAINPLIFISRSSALKQYIFGLGNSAKSCCKK